MKRILLFILALAGLSALSGYLISKASWIGKLGLGFFYKEYVFLKIWWQGALVVFGTLLALFIIQLVLHRILKSSSALFVHILALILALIGLYLTYSDFSDDISHHLMGERFHLGFYLFWLGWMGISLFYIFSKRTESRRTIVSNKKDSERW